MSRQPIPTEMERLQQLEIEIEQDQKASTRMSNPSGSSLGSNSMDPGSTTSVWHHPWGLLALGIGGIVLLGFLFKLVSFAIKAAIVLGIGYVVFRFGILPRLQSGSED